mmetsp:Transcript_63776/g.152069  ORF Transcript_63776/g.152069 Transcript_63776/m.152069 type:complete len:303 (-) Transcript_63776:165-1073(-)|eukprot:CAMPEP_0178446464 /NCGR_PEP_ID=MMETSP0689_2-20121128/40820_1 /TAXON_ID=160604 /ORGANISM="Amphidinium massartii, Strain CS-259" /LENGTH=302 /DNA_ID=CAMNT_0020071295 /DNA_START=24 /DNA_END=935 /DNA_ORIENTATION=+
MDTSELCAKLEALVAKGVLEAVLFDIGQTLVDSSGSERKDKNAEVTLVYETLREQVALSVRERPEKIARTEAEHADIPFPRDIPSLETFLEKWHSVAAENKIQKKTTGVAASFDDLVAEVASAVFGDVVTAESRALAAQKIADIKAARAEPMEGAAEAVATLCKVAGLKFGIVSNSSDSAKQRALLEKSGLTTSLFGQAIVISADVGVAKPNPLIFQEALRRLNVKESDSGKVVMVGDMLRQDVYGSRQVGIRSIWMPTKAAQPGENAEAALKEGHQPDVEIANLRELPTAILQVYARAAQE